MNENKNSFFDGQKWIYRITLTLILSIYRIPHEFSSFKIRQEMFSRFINIASIFSQITNGGDKIVENFGPNIFRPAEFSSSQSLGSLKITKAHQVIKLRKCSNLSHVLCHTWGLLSGILFEIWANPCSTHATLSRSVVCWTMSTTAIKFLKFQYKIRNSCNKKEFLFAVVLKWYMMRHSKTLKAFVKTLQNLHWLCDDIGSSGLQIYNDAHFDNIERVLSWNWEILVLLKWF